MTTTRAGELPCIYQLCAAPSYTHTRAFIVYTLPWNNGKSGAKLDLTSSTTPELQIHKVDNTWTANPCGWLPCRRATLILVGCPHSLVYLHLPVVEGLIFCISATPNLGTSFPLFHDPYSYGVSWTSEKKYFYDVMAGGGYNFTAKCKMVEL